MLLRRFNFVLDEGEVKVMESALQNGSSDGLNQEQLSNVRDKILTHSYVKDIPIPCLEPVK